MKSKTKSSKLEKKRQRVPGTIPSLALLAFLVGAWSYACGGSATTQLTLGGETHFLSTCISTCEGELECIDGVCTRACALGSSECSDLGASCTPRTGELDGTASCDVACEATVDCRQLGGGHTCRAGFCRRGFEAETQAARCASAAPACDEVEGCTAVVAESVDIDTAPCASSVEQRFAGCALTDSTVRPDPSFIASDAGDCWLLPASEPLPLGFRYTTAEGGSESASEPACSPRGLASACTAFCGGPYPECEMRQECTAVMAARLDPEAQCILSPLEIVGCAPSRQIGDAAIFARRGPDGSCWQFNSGGFPDGFVDAAPGDPCTSDNVSTGNCGP